MFEIDEAEIKRRQKINKIMKGVKSYVMNDRIRKKMSISKTGRKLSELIKRKMSETHKRIGTGRWMKYKTGENTNNW